MSSGDHVRNVCLPLSQLRGICNVYCLGYVGEKTVVILCNVM